MCGVDGLMTMNGSGVEAVSPFAPVSNQMKTAVWPAVYGACVRMPAGPSRKFCSYALACAGVPVSMSFIWSGAIQTNLRLMAPNVAGSGSTSAAQVAAEIRV